MRWTSLSVVLLLAACHVTAPTPAVLVVNDANNGQSVSLTKDGTLTVRLSSNPSTGFQWEWVSQPAAMVLSASDSGFDAPPTGAAIGASGEQWWTFRAVGGGTTTLHLRYVHPWEPDTATGTFTLTVTVG